MASQSSQDRSKHPRRQTTARPVNEILSKVIEPVLARKTGMKLDLMRAWPELAGPDYKDVTRPEKIDWPRRRHEDDPFEPGTLVVACEPAAALFFQHEADQILERLNVFFGFNAVKRIKILQKPVLQFLQEPPSKTTKPISEQQQKKLEDILNSIEDPELRETISKLGKGVMSNGPTSLTLK